MEETNTQIPMSVRYGLQMSPAVMGEQTLCRYDSVNGNSFKMNGQSSEIRINISGTGFLLGKEGYLYFEIQNTDATNDIIMANGCADVIESLRIESNNVECERRDGYGLIHSIEKAYTSFENAFNAGSFEGAGASTLKQVDAGETKSYVLRLHSGFLSGGKLGKAIPLMGSAGITLILRLQRPEEAFVQAAAGSQATSAMASGKVLVNNVRYYAPVFQIQDAGFASRYSQMLSQVGIEWSGVTSKRYVGSTGSSTGPHQMVVNDRSISLRGMVACLRPNATKAEAYQLNTLSSDINGTENYKFMISGIEYPLGSVDVSVNEPGRCYLEAIKLFSTSVEDPETVVDVTSFTSTTGTGADNLTKTPQGIMCCDLKRFGDKHLSLTGLATAASTQPSQFEVRTTDTFDQTRLDVYSICDAIYRMNPDGSFSSVY